VNDKLLAYAYILTHEGYPCVFWQDWFGYGLARPGEPGGIERLVQVHERFAGGATDLRWVDDVFYAMERAGAEAQPGLVFGLNNAGTPQARTLTLRVRGKTLKPRAWSGTATPPPITAAADGVVALEVPARGYVVYA
jgi:alpha-amylase